MLRSAWTTVPRHVRRSHALAPQTGQCIATYKQKRLLRTLSADTSSPKMGHVQRKLMGRARLIVRLYSIDAALPHTAW